MKVTRPLISRKLSRCWRVFGGDLEDWQPILECMSGQLRDQVLAAVRADGMRRRLRVARTAR